MCIPALGLIGGLVSAAGTLAGAGSRSAQLKAQARFAERQAEIARERGALEAARQRRAGDRLIGNHVARFASGGVSLSGTPTTLLSDVQAENELDTDRIRLHAHGREDQHRFAAGLNKSRARSAPSTRHLRRRCPTDQSGRQAQPIRQALTRFAGRNPFSAAAAQAYTQHQTPGRIAMTVATTGNRFSYSGRWRHHDVSVSAPVRRASQPQSDSGECRRCRDNTETLSRLLN